MKRSFLGSMAATLETSPGALTSKPRRYGCSSLSQLRHWGRRIIKKLPEDNSHGFFFGPARGTATVCGVAFSRAPGTVIMPCYDE